MISLDDIFYLSNHLIIKFNLKSVRIHVFEGLDPAGPGFDSTKNGLNKTCARFVQVLHTNPGELGTNEQRGDLNFYANNKTNTQPGNNQNAPTYIRSS